jgi:D-alanyl-D-alanine carboxypeptidase
MPRWMGQGASATAARESAGIAAAIAEVNAELAASAEGDSAPRPAPRPGSGSTAVAKATVSGSPSTFAVAPRQATQARQAAAGVPDAGGSGSTGGNAWGVQLGAFRSKGDAERHLLTMALRDMPALNGGLRRIEAAKVQGVTVFRAQFVGLSQSAAESACASLERERSDCVTLAPGI